MVSKHSLWVLTVLSSLFLLSLFITMSINGIDQKENESVVNDGHSIKNTTFTLTVKETSPGVWTNIGVVDDHDSPILRVCFVSKKNNGGIITVSGLNTPSSLRSWSVGETYNITFSSNSEKNLITVYIDGESVYTSDSFLTGSSFETVSGIEHGYDAEIGDGSHISIVRK